jgi:multidrug resistance efflux pump
MSASSTDAPTSSPAVEEAIASLGLAPNSRPIQSARRLLVGAFALLVALLVFVPWQQNVRGSGKVIAYAPAERQQTLEAPIEGRVTKWHVVEGQRIKSGELIVEISDNDPEIMARLRTEITSLKTRISAAKSRAESIESRIEELEASKKNGTSAATSRVSMARQRIKQASQSVAAAEMTLKTADSNYDRQRSLFEQGLSSKRQVELAELDQTKAKTELDRARATADSATAEESAIGSDRDKTVSDVSASIADAHASRASALSEEASAQAELARTEVRLARQGSQVVTAPRDGVILHVIARQGGEMVKPGDALVSFVPDADVRAVALMVDGNDVPLIQEGRHVRIQFEGWPALQFSGWPNAAVGTFGGRVAVVDAGDDGSGKFRIVVVPDGSTPWPSSTYLRQGTRANGWVLLDRVRLGFEIWREFNGFPPAVKNAPPEGKKG